MGVSHLYGRGRTDRQVFPFSTDRPGRRHPILTANKRYVRLRNGGNTAHHSHHSFQGRVKNEIELGPPWKGTTAHEDVFYLSVTRHQ